MSQFYGTLQGNRGEATRCGTANSGIVTYAAGWKGAICVNVSEVDGEDMFTVSLVPWSYSGGCSKVLAQGKLDSNIDTETFSRTDEFPFWVRKRVNARHLFRD